MCKKFIDATKSLPFRRDDQKDSAPVAIWIPYKKIGMCMDHETYPWIPI